MPPESGRNNQIIGFLFLAIAQIVGFRYVRSQNTEIQVRGNPQNRWPDVVVLDERHPAQLQRRSTVTLGMMPPLLVIEVVSPGNRNHQRDYKEKLVQYQDRHIPEYWIVDPNTGEIWVHCLDPSGTYAAAQVYRDDEVVVSAILPQLKLTVRDILSAGD